MKPAVLIFASKSKPKAQKARTELVKFLKKEKIEALDLSESTDKKLSESKLDGIRLGVAIGGDGTFLTLVRRLEKKDQFPILGINLGTLGFITEIGSKGMCPAVKAALEGKFTEENRPLIEVELWRQDKKIASGTIFNDAVISKEVKSSMIKLELSIDGHLVTEIRCDGLILATPTGSTAYALSAGGPIVHPSVNGVIAVPLASHSLSSRPIILPHSMSVEASISDFSGAAYLVFDGHATYELKPQDQIRMHKSDSSLRLIHPSKNQWPETIRTKLGMK